MAFQAFPVTEAWHPRGLLTGHGSCDETGQGVFPKWGKLGCGKKEAGLDVPGEVSEETALANGA